MRFSLEALAAGATIFGTLVSLLALIHSGGWLVASTLGFAGLSLGAFLYARKGRLSLTSASTVIEGHSIDSLNVANLRRQVNRNFFIQEVHHDVRIEGETLRVSCRHSGYARADQISSFDFSIDADDGTPFAELDCVAYDLGRDPDMLHSIRPLMTGTEGISKKLSFPFLEPLKKGQAFSIVLNTTLPAAVKMGFGYYTATLSFAQDRVRRCVIQLEFVGIPPKEMRVYGSTPGRVAVLVKTLPPTYRDIERCEYLDVIEDARGQSSRIYVFWRDSL